LVTSKNSIFKNLVATLRAGSSFFSSLGLAPVFLAKVIFRSSFLKDKLQVIISFLFSRKKRFSKRAQSLSSLADDFTVLAPSFLLISYYILRLLCL